MSIDDNKKKLLVILGVLVIIRLVLFPIIEWQNEQVSEIADKQTRLMKVQALVAQQEQLALTKAEIEAKSGDSGTYFYQVEAVEPFKLLLQKDIEKLFSDRDISITNFSWANETVGDVIKVTANISFNGTLKNFIRLQSDTAQLEKIIKSKEWNIQVKRMNKNSLGRINGRMLIEAYNLQP